MACDSRTHLDDSQLLPVDLVQQVLLCAQRDLEWLRANAKCYDGDIHICMYIMYMHVCAFAIKYGTDIVRVHFFVQEIHNIFLESE